MSSVCSAKLCKYIKYKGSNSLWGPGQRFEMTCYQGRCLSVACKVQSSYFISSLSLYKINVFMAFWNKLVTCNFSLGFSTYVAWLSHLPVADFKGPENFFFQSASCYEWPDTWTQFSSKLTKVLVSSHEKFMPFFLLSGMLPINAIPNSSQILYMEISPRAVIGNRESQGWSRFLSYVTICWHIGGKISNNTSTLLHMLKL